MSNEFIQAPWKTIHKLLSTIYTLLSYYSPGSLLLSSTDPIFCLNPFNTSISSILVGSEFRVITTCWLKYSSSQHSEALNLNLPYLHLSKYCILHQIYHFPSLLQEVTYLQFIIVANIAYPWNHSNETPPQTRNYLFLVVFLIVTQSDFCIGSASVSSICICTSIHAVPNPKCYSNCSLNMPKPTVNNES